MFKPVVAGDVDDDDGDDDDDGSFNAWGIQASRNSKLSPKPP